MDPSPSNQMLCEALRLLAARCPRLVQLCYWAGTSTIAIEELGHRSSFDLDFHTRKALQDTRPVLADIERAFPGQFEMIEVPDGFGSGFGGVLTLPDGATVPLQVLANYEDVPPRDLVPSTTEPRIWRVTLGRYLADKVQCIVERAEARDLVDIRAVLRARPDLTSVARAAMAAQDGLLLAERLTGWSEEDIAADLSAYRDVDPADAIAARDRLLAWLREDA